MSTLPLRRLLSLVTLLALLVPSVAHASFSGTTSSPRTIYVSLSGDDTNDGLSASSAKRTIQAGVNAANSGDTVLVGDGTYTGNGNRDIDFLGKSLTVSSVNGPTKTVIDCGGYSSTDGSGNHRGFYIHRGELSAVVSGFTVKNGYEITTSGNTAIGDGGGVYIYNDSGSVMLTDCIVSGNTAYDSGGVYVSVNLDGPLNVSSVTLTNCTVSGNTALYGKSGFGGILSAVGDNGTVTLTNCTVSGNGGIGLGCSSFFFGIGNVGSVTLTNDIVYNNTGIAVLPGFRTVVNYCDIQGGYTGIGNISTDPKFVRSANPSATPPDYGDLHLQSGSPCLGTGATQAQAPSGVTLPTTDLDGNTRPSPPSMGAYELASAPITLQIMSARMVSSHKLSIATTRAFGAGPLPVTITATINGQPVTQTQSLTSSVGTDASPFVFDLSALNVPRFTKNERFTVTATVAAPTGSVSDSRDVVVWLPTVLVPGINGPADLTGNPKHPAGGDGTFPYAEAALEQASLNYLSGNNCLGEPYSLFSSDNSYEYPTLTTLSYDRDNDSFAAGAAKLTNLVGLVKLYTYADKVNVVTHSKGGLIARAYLQYQASQTPPATAGTINRLIMTVPPNTGSAWAKLDVIGFGLINYSNLYPLWPWYRVYPYQPFIGFGAPNSELAALDAQGQTLPPSVKYTIIYSDKYVTPETITTKPLIVGGVLGVSVPPLVGVAVGDSVVPYYSQEGLQYNPNTPGAPFTMIPPFQNVLINHADIAGYHDVVPGLQSVSYLDLSTVDDEILSEIMTDF